MAEGFNPFRISSIRGLQVIDSRGDPTVEVLVITEGGGSGRAIAPSGASKGKYEAVELRDNDIAKFKGRSVLKAVENVNTIIARALRGLDSRNQRHIDRVLIEVDGTPNKSRLGTNATTATSLAVLKAAADTAELPLFTYIGGPQARILPIPMLNVINGGIHAGNELAVQEFLIVPLGADSFFEAIKIAIEIYKDLKRIVKDRYGSSAINVGDEGGYAPPMKFTEEALQVLEKAIEKAGYELGDNVYISLDAAATQFYDESRNTYRIDGKELNASELLEYWLDIINRYAILSIEDPFHEEDFKSFASLASKVKNRCIIIGDDLTTTNINRLKKAIGENSITGVIIKINQAGTFTEAADTTKLALTNGIKAVISHRSGDSEDNVIAHIAVGLSTPFIKTGAPARGERTAKYNELLRIEDYLSGEALYAGKLLQLGK